jgi:Skp family chaperone for outer membrane proteins
MKSLVLAALFFYAHASAAELIKIGFVDTATVFEEYIKAKELAKALNREVEQRRQKMLQKQKEIEILRKSLKEQAIFTEREKRAREEELKEKERELDLFIEDAKKYLMQKEQTLTKGIIDDIYSVIEEIATEMGLSVVLDKQSILYGAPVFDITEKVIQRLNRRYKDEAF